MGKKKIDLNMYLFNHNEDEMIRRLFFNDRNLRTVFLVLYNENPCTLSTLTNIYNQITKSTYSRIWVYSKLKKLECFGLWEKKHYEDCVFGESDLDKEIQSKHSKWILTLPIPFRHRFDDIAEYYFLSEKGDGWVNKIKVMMDKEKR